MNPGGKNGGVRGREHEPDFHFPLRAQRSLMKKVNSSLHRWFSRTFVAAAGNCFDTFTTWPGRARRAHERRVFAASKNAGSSIFRASARVAARSRSVCETSTTHCESPSPALSPSGRVDYPSTRREGVPFTRRPSGRWRTISGPGEREKRRRD